MKLSFKKLAVAVALAATAASASAAIDNGYASGNGELFLNVWDANGSYTLDLDISIDSFQSLISQAGNLDLVYSADTLFSSFLSGTAGGTRVTTANALRFDVLATDVDGDNRIVATYATANLPTKVMTDGTTSSAAAKVMDFANLVNKVGDGSIAVTKTDPAYANKSGTVVGTINGLSFSNFGAVATATSYASGLNLLRIDGAASGDEVSLYTQYTDNGTAVRAWFDANNALHIAAAPVPEPESYAMLLAGLGMVGFMARRRLGKRA